MATSILTSIAQECRWDLNQNGKKAILTTVFGWKSDSPMPQAEGSESRYQYPTASHWQCVVQMWSYLHSQWYQALIPWNMLYQSQVTFCLSSEVRDRDSFMCLDEPCQTSHPNSCAWFGKLSQKAVVTMDYSIFLGVHKKRLLAQCQDS